MRFGLCLILLVGVLSVNASTPLIVAHRGASHDAPENTLAAFKLAWEQGADAVEGDFMLTADGEIVCFHDKTTKRLTDQDLEVSKTTLAELQNLDLGSWKDQAFEETKIPVLSEVLATLPEGKQIFVEIKCGPEIIQPLVAELNQGGLGAMRGRSWSFSLKEAITVPVESAAVPATIRKSTGNPSASNPVSVSRQIAGTNTIWSMGLACGRLTCTHSS
jgi:glycerophosphoryl diester phosphodiesterase